MTWTSLSLSPSTACYRVFIALYRLSVTDRQKWGTRIGDIASVFLLKVYWITSLASRLSHGCAWRWWLQKASNSELAALQTDFEKLITDDRQNEQTNIQTTLCVFGVGSGDRGHFPGGVQRVFTKTASDSHLRPNRKWKYGRNYIFELAAINFLFNPNTINGSIRHRFQAT